MKVVAMIERSAGNESVGEMWTETKVFDAEQTIAQIYQWVVEQTSNTGRPESIRMNIKLSVAQE